MLIATRVEAPLSLSHEQAADPTPLQEEQHVEAKPTDPSRTHAVIAANTLTVPSVSAGNGGATSLEKLTVEAIATFERKYQNAPFTAEGHEFRSMARLLGLTHRDLRMQVQMNQDLRRELEDARRVLQDMYRHIQEKSYAGMPRVEALLEKMSRNGHAGRDGGE